MQGVSNELLEQFVQKMKTGEFNFFESVVLPLADAKPIEFKKMLDAVGDVKDDAVPSREFFDKKYDKVRQEGVLDPKDVLKPMLELNPLDREFTRLMYAQMISHPRYIEICKGYQSEESLNKQLESFSQYPEIHKRGVESIPNLTAEEQVAAQIMVSGFMKNIEEGRFVTQAENVPENFGSKWANRVNREESQSLALRP